MTTETVQAGYRVAHEQAVYYSRPALTIVSVTGRDRADWLHKLVTADVKDLAAGQGARSALLDAKGHFVAIFSVLVRSDDILLVADESLSPSLYDALRRYIFREKVTLTDVSTQFAAFTLIGPNARSALETVLDTGLPTAPLESAAAIFDGRPALVIASDALSVPGLDALVDSSQREAFGNALNVQALGDEAYEILRVEAGTMRWGVDVDESVLALEAPLGLNIRVDQGCYVGQEVVARIVHRGHVNRQLVGVALTRPDNGVTQAPIQLRDRENEVGQITSLVQSPTFGWIGLGMVRREYAGENQVLDTDALDTRAKVVKLPFA